MVNFNITLEEIITIYNKKKKPNINKRDSLTLTKF